MKITVLGSGSAFSSENRFNSCYFVEAGEDGFLIDCGSDAMRAIQRAGVDFFAIREIFVTHMHADHAAGLPAVLTAMHVQERKQPLTVYIPHTQIEFAKLWLANMFVYNDRMSFSTTLLPLAPGVIKLRNNLELEFISTKHLEKYAEYARKFKIEPVSYSVIVREGSKKFYFSSDVVSFEETNPWLDDGTAFLESTHPPLEDIAAIHAKGNAKTYFTHIPKELEHDGEWTKELSSKFGIKEFRSVRDGQVIIV